MKTLLCSLVLVSGGCYKYNPHDKIVVDDTAIRDYSVTLKDGNTTVLWPFIEFGVAMWRQQMGVNITTIEEEGGDTSNAHVLPVFPTDVPLEDGFIAAYYPTEGVIRFYTKMDMLSERGWVQTTAHEIGHAFGMQHPPKDDGCHAIMAQGCFFPKDEFQYADYQQFCKLWPDMAVCARN